MAASAGGAGSVHVTADDPKNRASMAVCSDDDAFASVRGAAQRRARPSSASGDRS